MNPNTKLSPNPPPPTPSSPSLTPNPALQSELAYIINICGSNSDISNRQIRSILSMLAGNIQDLLGGIGGEGTPAMIGERGYNAREEIETMRDVVGMKIGMLDRKVEKSLSIAEHRIEQANTQILKVLQVQLQQQHKKTQHELTRIHTHFQTSLTKTDTALQTLSKQLTTLSKATTVQQNLQRQTEQQLHSFIRETEQKNRREMMGERLEICQGRVQGLVGRVDGLMKGSGVGVGDLQEKIRRALEPERQKIGVKKPVTQQELWREKEREKQRERNASKIEKVEKMEKVESKIIIAQDWIDKECLDFSKVTCLYNSITAKSSSNIFSSVKISQKPSLSFKIAVLQDWLFLGLADITHHKNPNTPALKNLLYYQNNCYSWQHGNWKYNQGQGFKAGETVTVSVDLDGGFVVWRVGEIVRFRLRSEEIRDRGVEWVWVVGLGAGGVVELL